MKKQVLMAGLMIVIACLSIFLLVSCDKLTVADPTNVKYDGSTITWDRVDNADNYVVSINDGEERTVSAPSYPYDAQGKQFNVTIKAVSKAKKIIESGVTLKTFVPLGNVSEIRVSNDGVLSWDSVENATGYLIRIDGAEISEPITETSYSGLTAGAHSVSVRPVVTGDSSYFSKWSESKSLTILGVVEKNDIVYKNGKISWKYVSGARGYELKINGVTVEENIVETNYTYDADRQDFEVTVRALGNHTSSFDGKTSESKAFIFLDTVTNVRVEDGNVVWNSVAGADSYIIKLNGKEFTVIDPRFNNLTENVSTDVQVIAVSSDTTYFSDWSTTHSLLILPAPSLQWNSALLLDGVERANTTWDGIPQASGYNVRLTLPNGTQELIALGEEHRSFSYAFLQVGSYKIEVQSAVNSSSGNIYDSRFSVPITLKRLAAPVVEGITSNPDRLTDGFTATFTKVDGATSYALFKDGISITSTSLNQFKITDLSNNSVTEEQRYVYSIQSIGKVENTSNGIVVMIDSLPADNTSFNITVLATPSGMDMSGFEYTFNTVSSGANGYSVNVGSQRYTTTGSSRNLQNLEAGTYDVNVCTRGNGSNILPSDFSATIRVIRLAAPLNIRVGTLTNEGTLMYDSVDKAQSYDVVFDGNTAAPVPATEVGNINNRITTSGTTVHMYSIANYFNELKTEYYMTSQSSETKNYQKLAIPNQITFSNTQIIWNAPANINTSEFAPSYAVADGQYQTYNGEKTGTAMDITYLDGGRSYTFCVKAIGDGQRFVNSEYSDFVTVWKLAAPEVTRTTTSYTWPQVINAVSYVVYVDGQVAQNFTQGSSTYSFVPDFVELKTYKVEVYAVGDEGLTSIRSDACSISQATKQLTKPEFSISYSHDSFNSEGEIQVAITKEPANANGYVYQVAGVTSFKPVKGTTTYSHNPGSPGKYTVSVYALGGSFDDEGMYYLNSQNEGGNDNYSITLLGSPNSSTISFSKQGLLTWTAVSGAVGGYKIEIEVDGGVIITQTVTQPNYTLENYSSYNGKVLTVKITALGNGNKVINSGVVSKDFTVNTN